MFVSISPSSLPGPGMDCQCGILSGDWYHPGEDMEGLLYLQQNQNHEKGQEGRSDHEFLLVSTLHEGESVMKV